MNKEYIVDSIKKMIKGCLKGRKTDQYRLYALYAKKMFGICLRYAANHDEAQDVLQEGFIKVFQKLDAYKGKGSLEGWIRRIIVNTAIEKYREKIYHLSMDDIAHEEAAINHQNLVTDALHAKDILALVQKLPVQYRLVFNLYALEGFNHREIGDKLRISESTSRSNLARARMILKDKLNKESEILLKVI